MSRFKKLRELVTLARNLESEALRMSGRSRTDRLIEAEEYRAKAEWLAGRIEADEYNARLVEALDARTFATE